MIRIKFNYLFTPPLSNIIQFLRNINNIRFRVSSRFDNTVFVSADNTKSRYNIVLTFREYGMDKDMD